MITSIGFEDAMQFVIGICFIEKRERGEESGRIVQSRFLLYAGSDKSYTSTTEQLLGCWKRVRTMILFTT